MGDRPNAKPLATTDDLDEVVLDDEDDLSGFADTAAIQSMQGSNDSPGTNDSPGDSGAESGTGTGKNVAKTPSSASRRLTVGSTNSRATKKSRADDVDGILSSFLGEGGHFQDLREREVVAREQEASARMMEAQAISKKAESESNILSIQARATLLRERKRLLDEGVSKDDIDELLPLKK